ncbi:unnamed protein product, partial [Gongylonema pulchrum]|uniref:MFS domain-containing protein n=1 Tax=Gongylonema pulchrum TaxID=637853 RepID=A0A183DHG9_9BILA
MVFGLLGLLSAFATTAIPVAARFDLYCFVAVRTLQGIAYAANFSVIGNFLNKWSYMKQSGLFISVLVSFFQVSPAVTMPSGGYICSHYQWPYIYYSHGIASFVLFSFFIIAYRNSPHKHPLVTDIELKKIAVGKED